MEEEAVAEDIVVAGQVKTSAQLKRLKRKAEGKDIDSDAKNIQRRHTALLRLATPFMFKVPGPYADCYIGMFKVPEKGTVLPIEHNMPLTDDTPAGGQVPFSSTGRIGSCPYYPLCSPT